MVCEGRSRGNPHGHLLLARAIAGYEVDGEASALPEPWKTMVALLARVPVDESLTGDARRVALAEARAPLVQAMLAARDDRDSLIRILSEIDPEAETPEAGTDEKRSVEPDEPE